MCLEQSENYFRLNPPVLLAVVWNYTIDIFDSHNFAR